MDKGDRVAVVFQQLENEVGLGDMWVHFRAHLSSTSSICNQEQDVPTISTNRIYLLLEKRERCYARGFSCWSEVHLRLNVYGCTILLVALSEVVHQNCDSLFR